MLRYHSNHPDNYNINIESDQIRPIPEDPKLTSNNASIQNHSRKRSNQIYDKTVKRVLKFKTLKIKNRSKLMKGKKAINIDIIVSLSPPSIRRVIQQASSQAQPIPSCPNIAIAHQSVIHNIPPFVSLKQIPSQSGKQNKAR